MNTKIIILGAGAPHHGELPAALSEPRSGTSILQWLLDSSGCSIGDAIFVAGYQSDAVRARYPELKVVENTDWKHTGSGASLLAAPFSTDAPLLVTYSDILFRDTVPKALARCEADIAFAWDSLWEQRYSGRKTENLARCEKVLVNGDQIKRLGSDLPVDWANGEFIGLVRFSPRALERLVRLRENGPESLRGRHLSEYLEYLRATGLSMVAVDVAGDWAELNEPRDIAHFILGTKAETLGRLRGMVRHAVIQDLIAFTVGQWWAKRAAVLAQIRQRFAQRGLAVRSSARSEDSFLQSNAGGYDSVLNVDPQSDLEAAIERVITSYGSAVADDQVLIQPMVTNVALSGVAFTRTLEHGAPWYVINYETNGNSEAITSGISNDHRTLLLRRGMEFSNAPEPRLMPLVSALQEIEILLGYDRLDVEFAIDNAGAVHILQVRPITVPCNSREILDETFIAALNGVHARWEMLAPTPPHFPGDVAPLYGVMTDWNPAEIIGIAPGAMAVSLYRYLIMDEVWATQRAEYGYRDVRPAPLLVEFAGRPYVDVRASFASFLPAGLPKSLAERLLDFYLSWLRKHPELHDKVEFEVVPTCLGPGFVNWEKRLRVDGDFSDEDVAALREGLRQITSNAFGRYENDFAQLKELSDRFDAIQSNGCIEPLERARILLDDCRRLGTLPFAHQARSGFIAVTLLREAEASGIISSAAREGFFSTLRTVSHQLTNDAQKTARGEMAWDDFVANYGHLRPGTYDVSSPRYDADPEHFLRPLGEYSKNCVNEKEDPGPWKEERGAFFAALAALDLPSEPDMVERFLRQSIEGREYAKFIFSRNLSAALESLAQVGSRFGLRRENLAHISLEDMLAIRHTSRSDQVIADNLQQSAKDAGYLQELAAACELPSLITKKADLDVFIIGSDRPNFIGACSVTAECINLAKISADESPELTGRIVLIPQADPGYDWLFGQGIAGLVTLYGGANSHMAIRAAEFGLPAVIGVGEQRYQELAQARMLELSPTNNTLRVIR